MTIDNSLLEVSDLLGRGWTASLIRRFRPEPDNYRQTQHGLYHVAHQWRLDTIIRAEAAPHFQRALERTRGFDANCPAAWARETAADVLARLEVADVTAEPDLRVRIQIGGDDTTMIRRLPQPRLQEEMKL